MTTLDKFDVGRRWAPRLSRIVVPAALCLVLALSVTAGVSLGAVSVPFATVWSIVANKVVPGTFEQVWSAGRESIVWDVRFPRVILGALVGAGALVALLMHRHSA